MIEEDIKQTIQLRENVPVNLALSLVKQYLLDKTNIEAEDLDLRVPLGEVSLSATSKLGNLVMDTDLLSYFYFCSVKYYKQKFNIE